MSRFIRTEVVRDSHFTFSQAQCLLEEVKNGTKIVLPKTKGARLFVMHTLERVMRHRQQEAPTGHSGAIVAGLPTKAYKGNRWWIHVHNR